MVNEGKGRDPMRVALVHEWLVRWGGSESVLQSFSSVFPGAPIHTLVHRPDPQVADIFPPTRVLTTVLHRLPGVAGYYPVTLPLMPWAWRRLRLESFDLILSSSHAFAKAVRKAPGALHVCYCHTPPRYLWDLHEEYARGAARLLAGPLLAWLRRQDLAAAQGVDVWIANSRFVAERIQRIYGAEAQVIYPPVDVDAFGVAAGGDYYLAGGRLVGYKRIDRAVQAANRAGFDLIVFGDGPERRRLERMAGSTVRFVGAVSQDRLNALLAGCRAYLFPGVEDFGILPVEAQAAGRPVVALARGGARESVIDGETGVLFEDDSVEGLVRAIEEAAGVPWRPDVSRANAERFSRSRFEAEIRRAVEVALGNR